MNQCKMEKRSLDQRIMDTGEGPGPRPRQGLCSLLTESFTKVLVRKDWEFTCLAHLCDTTFVPVFPLDTFYMLFHLIQQPSKVDMIILILCECQLCLSYVKECSRVNTVLKWLLQPSVFLSSSIIIQVLSTPVWLTDLLKNDHSPPD